MADDNPTKTLMPKKKIINGILLALLLILVAGGVFYYYKYYRPEKNIEEKLKNAPQYKDEADFLEKAGHPEKFYQFDGRVTNIDLPNEIITLKIEQVFNFRKILSADYKDKIYNFLVDSKTKFTEATIKKSAIPDVSEKTITINDIKIGDEISLIVPIEEVSKGDNFLTKSVVLMIFK